MIRRLVFAPVGVAMIVLGVLLVLRPEQWLPFGLMLVITLCLNGDMPDESHLFLLIKDHKFSGLSLKSSQKMSSMYLLYDLRFSCGRIVLVSLYLA